MLLGPRVVLIVLLSPCSSLLCYQNNLANMHVASPGRPRQDMYRQDSNERYDMCKQPPQDRRDEAVVSEEEEECLESK